LIPAFCSLQKKYFSITIEIPMKKMEFSHDRKSRKVKKRTLERLYDKKPLIELIVAILSIPSIILLVILNLNSLRNLNSTAKPTGGPVPTVPNTTSQTGEVNRNFFSVPLTRTPQPTQAPLTSQAPCNKSLGPVSIISPGEGDVVSSNPVEIDISYDDSTYCGAVWSYSVNGSNWSSYGNNSVALYNLPDGPITFQLRVMSITSTDQTTLTRHFTYNGQSTAPMPPSASNSAD
jgi:hypothetical protein